MQKLGLRQQKRLRQSPRLSSGRARRGFKFGEWGKVKAEGMVVSQAGPYHSAPQPPTFYHLFPIFLRPLLLALRRELLSTRRARAQGIG